MEENQINENRKLMEWLLENGGPVIRYRTAKELLERSPSNIDQIEENFLQSPIVNVWLSRLGEAAAFNQLHSSKVTAYENTMGKLIQLGCQKGLAPFDQKTQPYHEWLQLDNDTAEFTWTPFLRMLVASFLIAAGYHQDTAIQEYLEHRLAVLWRFTKDKDFSIYTDREQYADIPKGFRDKPLVKTEFYRGGEEQFPLIYDIYALANYPAHLLNEDSLRKIDSVIEYVLHPKYQSFPEGYGLMRVGKRKYYAIGWSVHLPKYPNMAEHSYDVNRIIQRLELMSNFRAVWKHAWFAERMMALEEYRTERGTYIFPRNYLPERRSGYWVTGAYMGLEENRRKKMALELESTFWMLKIRKNAGVRTNPA